MNAEIVSGGGQPEYFDGEVVTYECVTNFGTTTDPFTCTCDTITDPTAPDFVCTSIDLVNTCRRSKWVLYVAEKPAILKSFFKKLSMQVAPTNMELIQG